METEDIQKIVSGVIGNAQSVLDVGCGDCQLARVLAKNGVSEVIGIDMNQDKFPEKVWYDSGCTAECVRGDAHSMTFSDGSFDAVVSIRALHEIKDPEVALSEIMRVLKPGGTVLMADFSEGEPNKDEDYYVPKDIEKMLDTALDLLSHAIARLNDQGQLKTA